MKIQRISIFFLLFTNASRASLTWDTVRDQLQTQLNACKIPASLGDQATPAQVTQCGTDIATCVGCLGEQFNKAAIEKLDIVLEWYKKLGIQVAQAQMSASGQLNKLIKEAGFGSVAPQSVDMFKTQFVEQRLVPIVGNDSDAAHIQELLTIAKETVVMLAKIFTQDIEQIPLVFGKQSGPDFDDQQQQKALIDMTEIAASTVHEVIFSCKSLMDSASKQYTLRKEITELVTFLFEADKNMKRGESDAKFKYDKMQALATQYNSLFGSVAT